MELEELRRYIVIINGGSGVIYQASDIKHTYILTAKHVIEKADNTVNQLIRYEYNGDSWRAEKIPFELKADENYFADEQVDIAILKIARLDGFDQVFRTPGNIERNGYMLVGYPAKRRGQYTSIDLSNSFRVNEPITLQTLKNNHLREANIAGNPNIDEISGQSGGAIGIVKDNIFLLAGIQSQMAEAVDESLGAIEFCPISAFDQLVKSYPSKLSPLYPAFMGCFSHLKECVLKLDAGFFETNVAYTRAYLQDMTTRIVASDLTPVVIKDHFQARLLIHNQHENLLDQKAIWIAWLEFLIILRFIKEEQVLAENMEQMFCEYRLMFSGTKEDWAKDMSNIVKSDFRGLKKGGKVIIATDSVPRQSIIPAGIIDNIVRAREPLKSQMQIDEGIAHPLASYQLIHLHAFQEHGIINKAMDYTDFCALNEDQLVIKLQDEFNRLFAPAANN
ncbi:hypothetical protein JN11_00671 [Mucilaginibacter frigoritolerans]|uniref:ABC-three component systems C-terminal domain-containing protein n=1 Tax=Mucilaginibacter frigoritolerans TaxID=652788 RepID=A0A562UHM8_9SPHI|nr:ABC-three component system protein [Mucilaginibacter frigoritolerans]TWJ04947.1 hypothetical protein JN11_00671 [Mucilaginibacter frigoritolerans]